MAQWGRTQGSLFEQFRVKARARLTEREGLFLVTNVAISPDLSPFNIDANLSIFRDSYLRYAVK